MPKAARKKSAPLSLIIPSLAAEPRRKRAPRLEGPSEAGEVETQAPPIERCRAGRAAALDDLKAQNVSVLDVRHLTSVTDTMVVASGRSDRHVRVRSPTPCSSVATTRASRRSAWKASRRASGCSSIWATSSCT